MSDRDTLWNLLDDLLPEREIVRSDVAAAMVEAIEQAGWRPPAQVITDPDTPDTYPARTVGIDRDGEVWVSRFTDWVVAFDVTARGERLGDIVADVGPLTLVYIPTEDACPHDSRSGAAGRWRCDQCGADCGPDTYLTPTEEIHHG